MKIWFFAAKKFRTKSVKTITQFCELYSGRRTDEIHAQVRNVAPKSHLRIKEGCSCSQLKVICAIVGTSLYLLFMLMSNFELTHFSLMLHFCTPWKRYKIFFCVWHFKEVFKWNIGLKWVNCNFTLLMQTISLQIFKGCLPQISLGPFLNTLSQMYITNLHYFKIRNFRAMRFFWYFNFVVHPKYYISRHFNFAVWPKCHNSRHFKFTVLWKISFFMCVSFQYFRNFLKSKKPKSKLKHMFIFFFFIFNLQKY